MAKDNPFTSMRELSRWLDPQLEDLGFQRRKSGVYTLPLPDADQLGYLSVSPSKRYGFNVSSSVGVHDAPVQRALARLTGKKLHPYEPTIIELVRNLLPPTDPAYDELGWFFETGPLEPMETAVGLFEAIRTYGLPFIHEHTGLEGILRGLDEGAGVQRQYSKPVVLSLLGRHQEALDQLQFFLRRTAALPPSRAADEYQAFAAALQAAIPLTAA